MMRFGTLGALLVKHCFVRFRRWILTCTEVLVPLIPLIGFLIFYHKIGGDADHKRMTPTPHHSDNFKIPYLLDNANIHSLYYAPNTSQFTRELMKQTAEQLEVFDVKGFPTEHDLFLSQGKILQKSHQHMAVIFQNISGDAAPQRLIYTIRSSGLYNTDKIIPRLPLAGPHYTYGNDYYLFTALKANIDSVFIDMKSTDKLDVVNQISVQAFPYPAYNPDEGWWTKYVFLIPTMLIIGFMVPFLMIINRVMSDKASGIKELIKMMGVRLQTIWFAHYLNNMAIMLILTILFIIMFHIPVGHLHLTIVPLSSSLIVFISLLLYVNYVVLFAFAITTIFSKDVVACICGAVIWIASIITILPAVQVANQVSTSMAILYTLIPNYPFYAIFFSIGLREVREEGLGWSNLFSVTPEYPLSCGVLWIIYLIEGALLVLFIWYMDRVNPGPYGVAKPWTFPFKRIMKRTKPASPIDMFSDSEETALESHLEPPPASAEVGIEINNVWKVFVSRGVGRKVVLKGVSMNLYKGGITVLLGHNGAGKTTLMSIITGLTSATSGFVHLKGDGDIGLCPQHNLTFSDLTLRQHLVLFGLLKGLDVHHAQKEAVSVAKSLQLLEKLNWLCGRLSGGQRRRAQLGLALMGRPQILILDEPTTGLDPVSRRHLWDILLEMKTKHTILITSHSMEEADVLADRVAILDHGRLKCLGTPIFLKKTFCTGYTVKILTRGDEAAEREIERLVKADGAEVEVLPREGDLLSFRLLSHHTNLLPTMFNTLEDNKQRLDIKSIGLSLTTLEEVFLRVTEGCLPPQPAPMTILEIEEGTEKYLKGIALFYSQFFALFVRKLLYLASVKKSLVLQFVLALLMFLSPLMNSEEEKVGEVPPLTLTPAIFPVQPLKVLYSTPTNLSPQLIRLGSYYNFKLQQTSDAYNAVLEEGSKDPKTSYFRDVQLALGTAKGSICGFYSVSVYHALPVVTGLLTNLFAAAHIPGEPPHIVTTNHPISREFVTTFFQDDLEPYEIISWVSSAVLGYFFLLAVFIVLPVKERIGGQRHLQQLAGPSPWVYWTNTLITDLILLLPISTILFLLATGLHPSEILDLDKILYPILTLGWLHVLASLCFIYAFSLAFKSPGGAYISYFILTVFIGILISSGSYFASLMIEESEDQSMGLVFGLFSLLIPSYPFSQGLIKVAMLTKENEHCSYLSSKMNLQTLCCDTKDGQCVGLADHWSDKKNGIRTPVIFLVASFIFYLTLLLLVEYNVLPRLWEKIINRSYKPVQMQTIDEDVQREKKKVQEEVEGRSGNVASQVLVHRLSKRYKKYPFTRGHEALKNLSFSIQEGECFGLLGANGAGKSTTFNILAGVQVATNGACYFKGRTKVSLGYCPQFDALDSFLTGRQVLELFSRLRGVPRKMISSKVGSLLQSAALTEYGAVPSGHYSGGTRRRLSTVVALAAAQCGGDCVLLDEPSAGVDPHSRLALHSLIQEARSKGHCIVLSSHSMEECDKLVSRLGILRRGELACLGVPLHLKHKFSNGYLLTLRLRPCPLTSSHDTVDSPSAGNISRMVYSGNSSGDISQLSTAISETFTCSLKDQHLTILQYHIEDKNCAYSTMFTRMEELKARYENILEDYTISDTTLEQVFLSLSREEEHEIV